jgi:hypothetical protein
MKAKDDKHRAEMQQLSDDNDRKVKDMRQAEQRLREDHQRAIDSLKDEHRR